MNDTTQVRVGQQAEYSDAPNRALGSFSGTVATVDAEFVTFVGGYGVKYPAASVKAKATRSLLPTQQQIDDMNRTWKIKKNTARAEREDAEVDGHGCASGWPILDCTNGEDCDCLCAPCVDAVKS